MLKQNISGSVSFINLSKPSSLYFFTEANTYCKWTADTPAGVSLTKPLHSTELCLSESLTT